MSLVWPQVISRREFTGLASLRASCGTDRPLCANDTGRLGVMRCGHLGWDDLLIGATPNWHASVTSLRIVTCGATDLSLADAEVSDAVVRPPRRSPHAVTEEQPRCHPAVLGFSEQHSAGERQ
jgi:hypothetical protein